MEFIVRFIDAFAGIFAEAGLWLLIGFGVAGLLHAFVSKERLTKHLGKPGFGSVLKASLIGVPLPLCSCSVIPAAASLRQGGASKGSSAAFAVSTPEIDVPAASLTWALLGPVMAIARIIASGISAVVAGVLIDATDTGSKQERKSAQDISDREPRDVPLAVSSCCQTSKPVEPKPIGDMETERVSMGRRLVSAVKYAFVTLPADLVFWLVVGFAVSAAVAAFVPESWLTGGAGSGVLAMLAAMAFGLIVYVCATGSTPMAAALVAKGLGPGPALVFLLTGPATNPATMAWILKDLGARALTVYLASIAGVALAAGFALEWLVTGSILPNMADHVHGSTGSPMWGAILMAVMTYAAVRKLQSRFGRKNTDKSCCASKPATTTASCCSSKPKPAKDSCCH